MATQTMDGNGKIGGVFGQAQPLSGDLVDEFLSSKLQAALFGRKKDVMLGRLVIEGSLGRGAMGTILSAFDPVLDRHVAIKSLLPSRQEESGQLLREAQVLAKLDHPNVVSIFDVVENEDNLYLVMEQVEGGDLRGWMEEGHPWIETLALFVQIAQGLAAAHRLEIAHCDVKPENVVISDQRPRLIDFGLAFQKDKDISHGGTPAYLAPERVEGAAGSAKADQYAFFVSLVEAIEGQRPSGDHAWTTLPAWLQVVCKRGLHRDPSERFTDMDEVVRVLQPESQRSKRVIAAGTAIIAGLGVATALLATRDDNHPKPCQGAKAQIEAIWNEASRDTMKSAFAALGEIGAKTWVPVEQKMTHYTQEWVSLRTQSCMATENKEQSAQLLDDSMQCFDRRLLEVRSVSTLFASVNETAMQTATKTVDGMSRLSDCMDVNLLRQSVALPQKTADRETVRYLQSRFEAVRNRERRGEYKEALLQTAELIEQSEQFGYPPLTANVLLLRAGLQITLSELSEAEKTLRRAASAAARANDDQKVAEVWIRVIGLLARQSRYDEALTLEAVAITSAERIPDNYEIQSFLQNTLGGIYLAKARYQEALAAYKLALAMQRVIGSDGNPKLSTAIANVGLAKWNLGDLAGAEKSLQEALDLMLINLGPDHSQVAYVRQNIADLQQHLGDTSHSRKNYLEVLRIWRGSLGMDHPNLAYPYEQLALLAKGQYDFPKAEKHMLEALRLREENLGSEHLLVVQSLSVIGSIYVAENSNESLAKARIAVDRAIQIGEKLGEPAVRNLVYVLESRAKLSGLEGDWQSALLDREKVLRIRLDTLGSEHRDVGYSNMRIGRTFIKLGTLNKAEERLVEAERIMEALPKSADEDKIAVQYDFAKLRMEQKRPVDAIAILEETVRRATEANLDWTADIRFVLSDAKYANGAKAEAIASMHALRDELDSKHHVVGQVESWLEKH